MYDAVAQSLARLLPPMDVIASLQDSNSENASRLKTAACMPDGNPIVAGYVETNGNGDNDFVAFKLDVKNGSSLWQWSVRMSVEACEWRATGCRYGWRFRTAEAHGTCLHGRLFPLGGFAVPPLQGEKIAANPLCPLDLHSS